MIRPIVVFESTIDRFASCRRAVMNSTKWIIKLQLKVKKKKQNQRYWWHMQWRWRRYDRKTRAIIIELFRPRMPPIHHMLCADKPRFEGTVQKSQPTHNSIFRLIWLAMNARVCRHSARVCSIRVTHFAFIIDPIFFHQQRTPSNHHHHISKWEKKYKRNKNNDQQITKHCFHFTFCRKTHQHSRTAHRRTPFRQNHSTIV